MARKRRQEEHENHERWLVSYADFITLLFAFFVVMYSMSSVNEGKYRVLSDSMVAAFRSSARSLTPIQIGELVRSPRTASPTILEEPRPVQNLPSLMNMQRYHLEGNSAAVSESDVLLDQASQQLDYMSNDVEETLGEMIEAGLVTVTRDRLLLEVEINTSILFPPASAQPSVDAEIILKRLAILLSNYPNRIHVEGYTDDLPMESAIYPSNWELSSARAGAVVRLFAQYGIQPWRMASVGYGEHRPIADNRTPLGRAQNRRVVIVVMANIQDERAKQSYSQMQVLTERLEGASLRSTPSAN